MSVLKQGSICDTLEIEIIRNPPRICNILLIFPLSVFFLNLSCSLPNEQTPCLTLYGGARLSATPSCGQHPPSSQSLSQSLNQSVALPVDQQGANTGSSPDGQTITSGKRKKKKKHITVTHFVLDQRGLLASLS